MPFVRRRPLMRAAVVGGGAYAAGKHTARKEDATGAAIQDAQDQAAQAQQVAAQAAAQPAAAPRAGLSDDDLAKLKQLAELRDTGVLSEEEFEKAKKGILGG